MSYEAESVEFSKEKSPGRFQLGIQFEDQFQISVQLQLPINSIPKTEVYCKHLIHKNQTLPAMLFLLSDGSVSSIGQQNESMKHEKSQLKWALSCLCLATNAQDENDKLQLFPASDEVLLKYHPPLIKTKGQGEKTNYCVKSI